MQKTNRFFDTVASLIIPCKNEGPNVKMTVDSILAVQPEFKTEVIVVDDGSIDGCCRFLQEDSRYAGINFISSPGLGAAQARNFGASAAHGEYLIFCDAHITVPEGWLESLLDAFNNPGVDAVSPAIGSLENPAAVGYGQSWNKNLEVFWLPPPPDAGIRAVPLLPGGCIALRAEAFHRVGGFDKGFIVWGHEDVELSLKLWLFGYRLYVTPPVKILHLFRKKHPYRVTMDHVQYNLLRMAFSHFKNERVEKVFNLIKVYGQQDKIMKKILKGGALLQRQDYFARRKHDDDWFMNRFKIDF